MNLCVLVINLMTIASISGIPHNKSEHPKDSKNKNKIDRLETKRKNESNSDILYKKEWDSYWESYYRNLMNKLNAHTYRGKKPIFHSKQPVKEFKSYCIRSEMSYSHSFLFCRSKTIRKNQPKLQIG